MENRQVIGAAVFVAVAIGAVGYVLALKLAERKFRQLPWYKKVLLILVHKLPGR